MISNNLKKRIYTSLVLLAIVFLIFKYSLFLIYFLIILGVLSILEFLKITRNIFNRRFTNYAVNSFFISYISIFCLIFFLFSNINGLKIILFILLFGCIASDVGGFIFGKILGGPKLTKISPNKTYSGAMGSILLSLIIVFLPFFYLVKFPSYKIILIALVTSIFCQLGDLFFSYLKRKARIKDTGSFFPGHGGVLDRLDGILLGVPSGFFILTLLN